MTNKRKEIIRDILKRTVSFALAIDPSIVQSVFDRQKDVVNFEEDCLKGKYQFNHVYALPGCPPCLQTDGYYSIEYTTHDEMRWAYCAEIFNGNENTREEFVRWLEYNGDEIPNSTGTQLANDLAWIAMDFLEERTCFLNNVTEEEIQIHL